MKRCCRAAAVLILTMAATGAFLQAGRAAGANESAAKEDAAQPKEARIYAQVKSADPAACSVSVEYYDRDEGEYKTINIVSDKDTRIENAAGLSDLKKGDWLDATYLIIEGRNVAGSIVVEKEEDFLMKAAPEIIPPDQDAPGE